MNLNHKDKSLLLLISAVIIILWVVFSSFSRIFFSTTFHISDASKISLIKKDQWLNTSRALEKSDLKDRIILLDFWNYACVSCIQSLPQIKELERRFGSKLLIIGVHSGKFDNQKDPAVIKKSILKYNINYPVIHDAKLELWNRFKVKSWPTFILINPHGKVVKTYVGVEEIADIKQDVKDILSKFKFRINREPLPILLEKFSVIGNILSFPSKMEYAANFSYKSSRSLPVIFISNVGKNNIIVSSISGDIITKIGSGKSGFRDGDFESASFSSPQGLLYYSNNLYVADLGNNAVRKIDFKSKKVTTLIGSGQKGTIVKGSKKLASPRDFALSAPSDIEFAPKSSKKSIIISNSGSDQILLYNLKKKTISVLAGNGSQGMDDGSALSSSLSQTSDMAVFDNKIYFIDSESSSLRVINEKKIVKTLIGKGLSKFGNKNGKKDQALMQHPLALHVDDTGVYISDSFNHKIRKYNPSSEKITDFIGSSKKGVSLGASSKTDLNEPDGIVSALGNFYISDSNNNRILSIKRGSLKSKILDIMPPLKLPKEGFLEYLPNLKKSVDIKVASDADLTISIDIKKGWKINELGPSFVNLLRLIKDRQANLVANFDWHAIKDKKMKLPKLKNGKDYLLQGTIYYCQDKENALCYIKSYEQKIIPDSDEKGVKIKIKIGY